MREQGVIKKWILERGFGFIRPDFDGPEVFLHIGSIEPTSFSDEEALAGARIEYETTTDPNHTKPRAAKAVVLQKDS